MNPVFRSRARAVLFVSILGSTALTACGEGNSASTSSTSQVSGSLTGLCPAKIVIQTDWFPESEHGALYQLVGPDYTVDTERKTVTGSLIDSEGQDTGVDIQIRTGGPAIGYSPVSATMATDDSITMGYVNTDAAALNYDKIKTIGVVATLEINPQIIMWDPATYPDVEGIADLGKKGVTLNVFGGGTFLDVFVAEGILSQDQLDTSYDGSPARFIAEGGKIAQQGFVSSEPYLYKNVFTDWGKDVSYQLLHEAGFEIYAQPLAIRADDKAALAPCLKAFVPMVQRAAIDFLSDGSRANAIIVDAVKKFDDFWVYEEGVAEYSTKTQRELGLVGNGPDSTLGNFDFARANKVLEQMRAAGLDVPASLTAEDIYTNEFIDPSIGLR